MWKAIFLLAILGVMQSANTAMSADMAVFGIDLGKPIQLSECESETKYGYTSYKSLVSKTCVQNKWYKYLGYEKEVRTATFTRDECPYFVMGCQITLLEIDDNLEGVEFSTHGLQDQEAVFSALTEKYGKPSHYNKSRVQNKMGASFDSILASWKRGGIFVTMYGTFLRLDDGRVTIDTVKGDALRKSWLKGTQEKKIKL